MSPGGTNSSPRARRIDREKTAEEDVATAAAVAAGAMVADSKSGERGARLSRAVCREETMLVEGRMGGKLVRGADETKRENGVDAA